MKRRLALAVLLLSALSSFSQRDLTFNQLDLNDGLSAEFISYLMKDSRGFIWMCSNYGLIRYDGKDFYNFRNSFNDSTSISNDNVSFVQEDKEGYLWVSTNQGLNQFNPKTQKFKRFEHNPYDPNSIGSNEVVKSLLDSKGRLWIGTTNGLSLYLGNNTFKNWADFNSIEKPYKYTAHQIAEDPSDPNLLWMIGTGGLFSFNVDTEKFTEHIPPLSESDKEDHDKNQRKSFTRLYIDKDGSIWLGNNFGEIFHYQKSSDTWIMKSFGKNKGWYYTVNCITPADDSHLWISTGGLINGTTIHTLNKKTFDLSPYPNDSIRHNFPFSISGVTHVFTDNEGIAWFTSSRSICKLDPFLQYFSYHQIKEQSKIKLPGRVSNIIEGGDFILMSMDNELFKLNKSTNKITSHQLPDLQRPNEKVTVHTLFFDDATHQVWTATSQGVYLFHTEKHSFTPLPSHYKFPKKGSAINSILRDSDGNIWVAFYLDGLFKFNPKLNTWIDFTNEIASIKNSPQRLKIYDLEEDKNGVIWIATHAGIRLVNRKKDKLLDINTYVEGSSKLFSLKVLNLTKDRTGNIWIGSLGNGLIGIKIDEPVSSVFWAYGTKEGLCDNNISNVSIEENGVIWATSHKGLICIDPSTSKIQNYYRSDGLVNDQMNGLPIHVATDGNIYIGTLLGYQSFNPKQFKKKTIVPPIQLRKVNSPICFSDDSLSENGLVLKYFENEFSFAFNALNYSKPEANSYKYQLTGFHDYWVNASAENNTVSYTNLNPGTYTFRVKASNHDGIWNDEGASIRITILPPPWKTWWVYSLYSILLIVVIVVARNEIIKRERLKTKAKIKEMEVERYHELDTIKSRFFANISHEFRTPLTLLLGPIEKRLKITQEASDKIELSIMYRNASRLLTLVNQLLDLSRVEAGTLRLKCSQGSLNLFINSIASQFSSMADSKEIDFAISANQEITLFFDSDKLEKIVTNLLSNAFKFTPNKGSITITLSQHKSSENFKDGFAEIAVWDSGKGIANEHLIKIFDRFYQADASSTREYEGSGIGLALTKELVELHKGSISVTSLKDEGSCFSVKLPLGSAHLKPNEMVDGAEPIHPLSVVQSLPLVPDIPSVIQEETALPKVLIVEDNSDLRYYLKTYFASHYSISEARDGEMGLTMAIEGVPDLIISDLMMPKMDGINLCSTVKVNEKTSHIPIILLTAKADIESKLQGLNTGADDYIAKPFDARELEVRVRNLIENRKKLHHKFSQQFYLSASELKVESIEDRFLKKVRDTIEQHMADTTFSVEVLAAEVAMSSVQVYRKLKALTGYTPNELIRNFRLERAASLLSQHAGNVSDVAYQVGFNNLSYFAKVFKDKYGVTPSEYASSGV